MMFELAWGSPEGSNIAFEHGSVGREGSNVMFEPPGGLEQHVRVSIGYSRRLEHCGYKKSFVDAHIKVFLVHL